MSSKEKIKSNPLFLQFSKLGAREGITSADNTQLQAMVLNVAEEVGPILERIRGTFKQYTDHSIDHSCNIARLVFHFLPKSDDVIHLNALELALLWLAILLHDVGMYVGDQEKQTILESDRFKEFRLSQHSRVEEVEKLNSQHRAAQALAIEDAIVAEFFRRSHAARVHEFLVDKLKSDRLCFRDFELKRHLGELCESHNWPIDHVASAENTVSKLDRNLRVGPFRANLKFLACCLRLGDILDFDRSRTPISVFRDLNFTEEISIREWQKHLSIDGWQVESHKLLYQAMECAKPSLYLAVGEFLDAVDFELQSTLRLIEEQPAEDTDKYFLNLPKVVERKLGMADKSFIPGDFRFQLEFDEIMGLLMDRSLYPDARMFLRELLQNSIDACRMQCAIASRRDLEKLYSPQIVIWDYLKDSENPRIIFQDNGVGMSLDTIRHFFLRVGKSYYRSDEFRSKQKEFANQNIRLEACSQFGIGFISCFMASNEIQVDTFRDGFDPLQVRIDGVDKHYTIKKLKRDASIIPLQSPKSPSDDGPPVYTGTRVTLNVNKHWLAESKHSKEDIHGFLAKYAVNVEFPIKVFSGSSKKPKIIRPNAFTNASPEPKEKSVGSRHPIRERLQSGGYPGAKEILEKILCPCTVPFEHEDLTGHLAFWLLKGHDEKPTPSCGHLRYFGSFHSTYESVSFSKEVALIEAFHMFFDLRGLEPALVLQSLRNLRGQQLVAELLRQHTLSIANVTDPVPSLPKKIRRMCKIWESLDSDLRESVLNSLMQMRGSSEWLFDPYIVEQLRSGKYDWCEGQIPQLVEFTFRCDQKLAQYGILIPEDIMTWNSDSQNYGKQNYWPGQLSMYLDVRGDLAMRPCAHRMFIDAKEARAFLTKIGTATLDLAYSLYEPNQDNEDWQTWFFEFVCSFSQCGDSVKRSYEKFDSAMRWKYFTSQEDFELLTRQEIIDAHGTNVPLLSPHNGYHQGLAQCPHDLRNRERKSFSCDLSNLFD